MENMFALVLNYHRLWGMILTPYIIEPDPNKHYYSSSQCLSPFPVPHILQSLEAAEQEVVGIINEYNDRNLFKLFSKDKTVKDFLLNVQQERIETHIRPYIEKRLYKSFSICLDEGIPVFFQKTKSSNLHRNDLLTLSPNKAFPLFRFNRNEDFSEYNLGLEAGGKKIDLKKSSAQIICQYPCIIKTGQTILFVSDIDGAKLKPFMTKEFIRIPKSAEHKYFSTFVLNAVNLFKVEASGFEILEIEPVKKAILTLEYGIKNYPVLTLSYNYQGMKLYASDIQPSFTVFEENDNKFIFRKFYRNFVWETECRNRLESLGFFSDDNIAFTLESCKQDINSLIEAVNQNFEEIADAGFELTSRLDGKYNLNPVQISIASRIINDWFDLQAIVTIGSWNLPFNQFKKNIIQNIREFVLPDGTIAILPETWFSKYKNIFELGKSENESIMVHKQHFSLLEDSLTQKDDNVAARLANLLIPEKISKISVPEGFKCQMRKYQSEGLNWLVFLQSAKLGGCLADDMGLGKTIQTLALLQHNKENHTPAVREEHSEQLQLFGNNETCLTSIIIVPTSLIYNWENEIKKYAPNMKVYSHKGAHRNKSRQRFQKYDIILSSYHTVRQDIDFISQFHFHYVILDESQIIKNPYSALYSAMKMLKSDFKLVLTGTPVENSLTDLWSQLNFVNPGLLGNINYFKREFAKPIESQGDDEKELNLKKIIKPFILRRTKETVASDLPPMTEHTVFCDMTEEQFTVYDKEKSAIRNHILQSIENKGADESAIIALQGLTKLRQLSNHPVLVCEDYKAGAGKFETVLQNIESVTSEGHKIIMFSSFVKHLNLYAEALSIRNIKYTLLTGSTLDREKIVNNFQNNSEIKIFLISLKAGGFGLNLTAADYVFLLDPWWNPASEMQAMSRAHRIGQDKNVFIYRYITSGSVEEKIVRLQERKSKLADSFITGNNPLKDIDLQNILELIS